MLALWFAQMLGQAESGTASDGNFDEQFVSLLVFGAAAILIFTAIYLLDAEGSSHLRVGSML